MKFLSHPATQQEKPMGDKSYFLLVCPLPISLVLVVTSIAAPLAVNAQESQDYSASKKPLEWPDCVCVCVSTPVSKVVAFSNSLSVSRSSYAGGQCTTDRHCPTKTLSVRGEAMRDAALCTCINCFKHDKGLLRLLNLSFL